MLQDIEIFTNFTIFFSNLLFVYSKEAAARRALLLSCVKMRSLSFDHCKYIKIEHFLFHIIDYFPNYRLLFGGFWCFSRHKMLEPILTEE